MADTGRIVKGIGGFYYVDCGSEIKEVKARGVFRKEGIKPIIGDMVELGEGSISKILPRKNRLVRPAVANIDNLAIVMAAKAPSPDTALTDKLTVAAERIGVKPIILINKIDLADPEAVAEAYRSVGYEVFCVSCDEGIGFDGIKELIKGKTTAFAGLSGVGKSSVLSILTGNTLETGSVSDRIERGKHTTRHVELLRLEGGGFVLDTPGFSSLDITEITDATCENLADCFPEIAKATGGCRFKGCAHINEPDCVVKAAVEDGAIPESRYESYVMLYNRLKQVKSWQ